MPLRRSAKERIVIEQRDPTPYSFYADHARHYIQNFNAITRDNKVFFGNDLIGADQLSDKVRDRLANKVDKRVYVKADARAKYGSVVAVVDNVRSAGVDQLGLLTEQRQPLAERKTPPPGTTGATGGQ